MVGVGFERLTLCLTLCHGAPTTQPCSRYCRVLLDYFQPPFFLGGGGGKMDRKQVSSLGILQGNLPGRLERSLSSRVACLIA